MRTPMAERTRETGEPYPKRGRFERLRRSSGGRAGVVMQAVLAVVLAAFIVGCPQPDDPPDEATLWDAVPRVDAELLMSSQL